MESLSSLLGGSRSDAIVPEVRTRLHVTPSRVGYCDPPLGVLGAGSWIRSENSACGQPWKSKLGTK